MELTAAGSVLSLHPQTHLARDHTAVAGAFWDEHGFCSCFSDLIYTKDRKVFIYLIILGKALLGLHQPWVMWCSGIKLSIQIYQKKK